MTLEQCINDYLRGCPEPGQVLDGVDDVRFGTRGGVLGPGKLLLEVTFTPKWKVPVFVGERELREAEERGFRRAAELVRGAAGPYSTVPASSLHAWLLTKVDAR